MQDALAKKTLSIKPIRTMINHSTTEVFFDNLEVPSWNIIGKEGGGFRVVLQSMNAERTLIASESIGDCRFFLDRAVAYSKERVVFGRPIGANQGIQFPIAKAYMATEAAATMVEQAATKLDRGENAGKEANIAKYLAAEAAFECAQAAFQTFGGFAFAEEYDIERKFRECTLYRIAPISANLVMSFVGQHVLGMPRSY